MKLIKRLLIPGVALSVLFGFSFADVCILNDGIYHNSELGLISIVENGQTIYTIQDKNIGATCTDINSSCSYGSKGELSSYSCPDGYSVLSSNFVNSYISNGRSYFQNNFYFPYSSCIIGSYDTRYQSCYWVGNSSLYLMYNSQNGSFYLSTTPQSGLKSLFRCQKNSVVVPDSSWTSNGDGYVCMTDQEYSNSQIVDKVVNEDNTQNLTKGLSSVVKFGLQFLPLMIFVFIIGYIIRKIFIRFGMLKSPGVALNSKTYNKGKN